MEFENVICWLRRDLRLTDHSALSEATRRARHVTVVFVFDTNILSALPDRDDRRVTFIAASLAELDAALRSEGSALVLAHGDPVTEIVRLAHETKSQAVFANEDYESYGKSRDHAVANALEARGISFFKRTDHVIFPGGAFTNQSGKPFRVFTPYKNAWLKRLSPADYEERNPALERLMPLSSLESLLRPLDLAAIGFKENDLWLEPGEQAGLARLQAFTHRLARYDEDRNTPSIEGTSGLSVHLRFGTVSIRACVRAAKQKRSHGAAVWLGELIWRDFFHMILDRFPHTEHAAFREEYQGLSWPGREEDFVRWCQGETGFPLVDAAMRHLKATGWMHNRLRMIVASFLVKDLLCDWRWGERYFARSLLDYDLAPNNGGWQWCASTGCDAQPYFRIFNPITQSRRFDAEGRYIRTHLPALAALSDKAIHEPAAHPKELARCGIILGKDYPEPVIDHDEQRFKVLALFDSAKRQTKT